MTKLESQLLSHMSFMYLCLQNIEEAKEARRLMYQEDIEDALCAEENDPDIIQFTHSYVKKHYTEKNFLQSLEGNLDEIFCHKAEEISAIVQNLEKESPASAILLSYKENKVLIDVLNRITLYVKFLKGELNCYNDRKWYNEHVLQTFAEADRSFPNIHTFYKKLRKANPNHSLLSSQEKYANILKECKKNSTK